MNEAAGRALWRCLHAFAYCFPVEATESEQRRAEAWLEWFAEAVDEASAGMCGCSRHWRDIVAKYPPNLRGGVEFFEWTVEVHNLVNERLGKPRVCYP
jgi:FAD-linked sulfhydryl oxidase